jgi:hypothetical protein
MELQPTESGHADANGLKMYYEYTVKGKPIVLVTNHSIAIQRPEANRNGNGTTHVGMVQRADWLIPMITDFLDSDLNPIPPSFAGG